MEGVEKCLEKFSVKEIFFGITIKEQLRSLWGESPTKSVHELHVQFSIEITVKISMEWNACY